MACFSIDVVQPYVGDGENPAGISWKFGGIWHSYTALFTIHETGGSFPSGSPSSEYRSDYALLLGLSKRMDYLFMSATAGISSVNYQKRGALLIPGTSSDNGTYQQLNGTTFGLAGSLDIYFTPVPLIGIPGIGFYGSWSKTESYFAFEISLLQINVPLQFSTN